MMDNIRIGARLRAARKAVGFKTSRSFIKKYKVPASTYSQHESGARIPDDETLEFYSEIFEISVEWLKTGKGNPFKKLTSKQQDIAQEELLDLSDSKSAKNDIINKKLLTDILDKMMQFHQIHAPKHQLSFIIKDAAHIYSDIIIQHHDKDINKSMEKLLKAYKKTYIKS